MSLLRLFQTACAETAMDEVHPSGATSGIKRANQQSFVAESAMASGTKRRAKSTEAGKHRSKRAAVHQLKRQRALRRGASWMRGYWRDCCKMIDSDDDSDDD